MSVPFPRCLYYRATRNEKAYEELLSALRYNLRCGHYTVGPCTHFFRCRRPRDEKLEQLERRLARDLRS